MTGARRVAEAVRSSACRSCTQARRTSTARGSRREIGPDQPYGVQRDLAHLSKVYAELCLRLYAQPCRLRPLPAAARNRLRAEPGRARGGRSPRRSWTSSRAWRRRTRSCRWTTAAAPPIGVVHVEDAARILLESPRSARKSRTSWPRRRRSAPSPRSPRGAEHSAARLDVQFAVRLPAPAGGVPVKLLVTGATGFLGWRTATLLRERGHDVVGLAPAGRRRALVLARPRWSASMPAIRRLAR